MVLVVVERSAPATELLTVVRALEAHPTLHPVVAGGDGTAGGPRPGGRLDALPFGRAAAEAGVTLLRAWRAKRRARRLLAEHRPVAVLAADDRSVGLERAVLACAAGRAPRLLVPYALSDPFSDRYVRRDRPALQVDGGWHPVRRALARMLPEQVSSGPGGRLLFYPVATTLGLRALGLLPRRPWTFGGSGAEVVATHGERERDQLVGWGVAPEAVVATGQPSLDDIRPRPRGEGGPVTVVCALPHLGEHGMLAWDEHERDVDWLLDELAGCGTDVVVSLHPKADPATYADRVTSRGLELANEPLRHVLPRADVFVATWSSTVRWALALGIPAVVLDHHDTGYTLFDDLAGVVRTRSRPAFTTELRSLVGDPDRRAAAARSAAEDAARLGSFDGGATARIVAEVERMASSGQ